MEKLILHPTDLSQWQALVNEAQVLTAGCLDEELESYLVFLLMRFSQQPMMASSALAVEYLETCRLAGEQRQTVLRDIGDKCLLLSGLFPKVAERKRVKVTYFIDLGQSAYDSLAQFDDSSLGELFGSLAAGFVDLMTVLHAMRGISATGEAALLPLDAAALVEEYKVATGAEELARYTQAGSILQLQRNKRDH